MESRAKKSKTSTKKQPKKAAANRKTKTVEVASDKKASPKQRSKTTAKKSAGSAVKRQRTSVAARRKRLQPNEVQTEVTEMPKNPTAQQLKTFQRIQKKSRELAKKRIAKPSSKTGFLAKQSRKGKKYNIDLRIHSPATEGYFSTGGVETNEALVRLAKVKGLHMIAVADFCDGSAVDGVRQHASEAGITVIPGFDLRCCVGDCSEVFITALFPEEYTSSMLSEALVELGVPNGSRGDYSFVLGKEFAEILDILERHRAIAIPTRMDKTPYRQLALPTLINEFGFRVFDLVHPENTEYFQKHWPNGGFTFLTFSNANSLAQVGGRLSNVKLPEPGFSGLRQMFARVTEDLPS